MFILRKKISKNVNACILKNTRNNNGYVVNTILKYLDVLSIIRSSES